MEIVTGHDNLSLKTDTVATIGTFDGLHLGHQAIIEATVAAAQGAGLPSLLLTFDVPPRQVLKPNEPVQALTELDDKLGLLDQSNLDIICVLKFSAIAKLSANDFYNQILREKGSVVHLFVGENFRFGAGATGNPEWLRQTAAGTMEVTEFPLERRDDTIISSTTIRNLLRSGDVDKIYPLLGRNIALNGRVVRGDGRGASLGFPTANLEFDATACPPAKGVYVGYLQIAGERLPSVINCGNKPTFGGRSFACEAHVLDYERELYGLRVKLELSERLRNEMKFPSPEALTRQITDDISRARAWFAQAEK